MSTIPNKAHVIVIGGGIVGNSLVYHLALNGWRDVVQLDKGPFPNPGGSTGHASNFIYPVDHSKEMTLVTLDSVEQYKELGVFTRSGGVEVARTEERMEELRRRMASAKAWGVESYLITLAELKELVPYINTDILLGAFYTPSVGVVDSLRAGTLMRQKAMDLGSLTVSPKTEVTGMEVVNGRIHAVHTNNGRIEAEIVMIASGVWSPRMASMAGIPGKFGDKPLGISDDLKQAHMNSDGYLESMQLLYDSIYTWFIRPSRDEERSTFSGLDFTFESGRVAMFECFSWADDAFSKFSSAGNWDVAAIPAGPYEDIVAPVEADSFAITKHSMNPDLAWSAATWLMQPEIQKRVCEALGCIPSRKSLAEDWVTKMTSQYPNVNFQVFIDSIAYMDASPNSQAWIPNHQKIWSAIENARNRIFGGVDDNVQQAMNRLNTQVQKELDDYWAGHP
jgi:choline dehydrogenase-like flavoprotein